MDWFLYDIGLRHERVKVNVYDFSVDFGTIDKSDILNIPKYLMVTNNVK